MKTTNLVINEAKGTITYINPNINLTPFENKIIAQYTKKGFTIRMKRKTNKNACHKREYYEKKLAEMAQVEKEIFDAIELAASFATAVKWYRAKFPEKNQAVNVAVVAELEAKYYFAANANTLVEEAENILANA